VEHDDLDYLPPPAARTLPMALGALLIAWVLAGIAFAIVQEGDQEFGDLAGSEVFAVSLPMSLAFAVAALLIAAPGGDPIRALRLRGFRLSRIGIGFAVGVATQLALIPLYIPILWVFDGDVGAVAEDLTSQFANSELWLFVLWVVVLAPVSEELFYRGLVQGSLERSMRAAYAVPIAALIFGGIHFQLLQLPGLFFYGLVSGILLVRYNQLSVSIAAHVGFNAAGVFELLADRFS